MIFGMAGVGKSDIMRYASALIKEEIEDPKFEMKDIRVGSMETGDLIGIPRVREVMPGEHRTVWSKPEWWPEEGTRGIIFLDELNRAGTNDVLQCLFQFVLGEKDHATGKLLRKCHTHVLPEGWSVMAAGNPDVAEYVTQVLDKSMLGRLVQIKAELDVPAAIEWMKQHLPQEEIWKFVQQNPEVLGQDDEYDLVVHPAPRAQEIISDMWTHMTDNDRVIWGQEMMAGLIGLENANLQYKFMNHQLLQPITAEELMEVEDFNSFYTNKLRNYVGDGEGGDGTLHLDVLNVTLNDVVNYVKTTPLNARESQTLVQFIEFLPPDMSLAFLQKGMEHYQHFTSVVLEVVESHPEYMHQMIRAMHTQDETFDKRAQILIDIDPDYAVLRGEDENDLPSFE